MWITNGGIADLAVVWARAEDGIRGFIVERGTPGFTTSDIHHKLSLRASVTSELHFADCRIPAANMLPEVRVCVARSPAWMRRASASPGA